MYAVMPWQGAQYVCKGGVMAYRECVADDGRALTDKDWRTLLLLKAPPRQPEWTRDFCLSPERGEEGP